MERRFSSLLLKYRWLNALASILFIVLASIGLQYSKLDADPNLYFGEDDVHLKVYKQMEERYGRIHQVILAVEAKNGDLYTPENLAVIEALTREAWKLPYVQRVDSLSNYAYSWSQDDELYVEELIENAHSLTPDEIAYIKDIALHDPAIKDRLASSKGPLALVSMNAALPHKDRVAEEEELTRAAMKLVKRIEAQNPQIDIIVSGNVISNTLTNDQAMADSMKLVPMMYTLIFALLGIFLRSIMAVFIIALITIFSCTTALGLAGHLGVVLNLLSITSINIIITVSIAHCVHVLAHFLQTYRSGMSKKEALAESLRINLQPIFLTSLTTALGFLSMNFSDMPPSHDLGNITAMGVAVAFTISLTLLPALIMLLPISNKRSSSNANYERNMDKFAEFVIRRHNLLGIGCIVISLAMLAIAPMNIVNDKFTENLKKPHPFRYDNERLDQYFGGLYTIEYDFKAKEGSSISDPEYLAALDKFTGWLRQHEMVRNVYSYSDIIKRLNKNMHGDDPAFYRIPDNEEEAAQYLLLYEMSQPFGADMSNFILPDKSATRMVVNIPSVDSIEVIQLREELRHWVEANMPDYMYHPGESLAVMWMYLGGSALMSSMEGALFALLLISLILTLVFRSIRYGIISLIPNLLPAGVGYGIWAIYSGFLDMSQMMVLSITIGIVVDDTVHFLSKYLRAKREMGADSREAVRYAFHHVGAPLWMTTVVLVLGFALFITSSFVPNTNLGLLTAIILTSALALDFFLLPPLLIWLDSKPKAA